MDHVTLYLTLAHQFVMVLQFQNVLWRYANESFIKSKFGFKLKSLDLKGGGGFFWKLFFFVGPDTCRFVVFLRFLKGIAMYAGFN